MSWVISLSGNIRSATRVTRRKGVGTLLNDGEQCKMSVTRVVTVVGFTTHYSMMASEVNNLQPPYLGEVLTYIST